jgi:hypothetical protein
MWPSRLLLQLLPSLLPFAPTGRVVSLLVSRSRQSRPMWERGRIVVWHEKHLLGQYLQKTGTPKMSKWTKMTATRTRKKEQEEFKH